MSNAPKSSLRDHLIATTEEGKIELTEGELNRVAGGVSIGQFKYWKWDTYSGFAGFALKI
jgi:hypothetical protein